MSGSRRTKRRYAHELFPHAEEWETRSLDVEVPYLIARAIGFDVIGTGCFEEEPRVSSERITQFLGQARIALLAIALHKGMTGDEAWAWADNSLHDEISELYEAAEQYGVNADLIKPYPCGPEPDWHLHYGQPDARGLCVATSVACRESECLECTEPVEEVK